MVMWKLNIKNIVLFYKNWINLCSWIFSMLQEVAGISRDFAIVEPQCEYLIDLVCSLWTFSFWFYSNYVEATNWPMTVCHAPVSDWLCITRNLNDFGYICLEDLISAYTTLTLPKEGNCCAIVCLTWNCQGIGIVIIWQLHCYARLP